MDNRKILYIAISILCVFAVIAAIFAQFDLSSNNSKKNTQNNEIVEESKTQEELKRNFNSIFDNQINFNNYDTTGISRQDVSKEIVYSAYDIDRTEDNKYEVNIHLPVFNINNSVAIGFNKITQQIFADKATEVLNNTKDYSIIYNVTYSGFVNGDVLSLIIKSTLKEGTSAQRTIVQTYNYNLKTEKEVTIYDAISQRDVSQNTVSSKINTEIISAIKEANRIQISGYETYTRDINSEIYQLANADTFFFGEDGKLYIIYAYGNTNFTSEMDIIEI